MKKPVSVLVNLFLLHCYYRESFCNVVTKTVGFSRDWGHKGYVEYRPGTANTHLILTSVHGGCVQPSDVPDRQHGCYDYAAGKCVWTRNCSPKSTTYCSAITINDDCTASLAETIWEEWWLMTGERPHLIISHLHRSKFDGNRDIDEAAQGHPDMEAAWHDVHRFINKSKHSIQGIALLVDVHGQAHFEEWVELGYGITIPFYEQPDFLPEFSYIANAIKLSSHSLEEVVRGKYSLGAYLQSYGHRTIPSPEVPAPKGGHYFSGGDLGYITWTHGSRQGGRFDSILVENPKHLRNPFAISTYGKDFANALHSFVSENYGTELNQ